QRGDPATQQQHVAATQEYQSDYQAEGRHHRGRAEPTDGHSNTHSRWGRVAVEPLQQGEVELRQRLMLEDVFGDGAKQPKRHHADHETDSEMEAQILARRETSHDEHPCTRIVRLEALYRSRPGDLLLDVYHTLGQLLSVCPKPTRGEPERHA